MTNDNKSHIASDIHWAEAIDKVSPYVFKIRTPQGHGSGYLMTTRKSGLCGLATAWHVVDHADEWDLPIKVQHHSSGKEITLNSSDRAIYRRKDRDVALIIFRPGEFDKLPAEDLTLVPRGKYLRQGLSIGWLGFPVVASHLLCFFEGKVSAHEENNESYLIDGVAINGVSGGPVFRAYGDNVDLIGCVSAYIPNRSTGESLPGICVVQSIEPFYTFIDQIQTIEDAREKADEIKTEGTTPTE